jgi:hypothetical protein
MACKENVADIKRLTGTKAERFIFSGHLPDVPHIVSEHVCRPKCFGKFWPKNLDDFLDWELNEKNIASRPPGKGKHQSAPIAGGHVVYVGKHKDKRGSDRVERVYCAFEVLRMSPRFVAMHTSGKGGTIHAIERLVAGHLGKRLRQGKRGRPRAGPVKFTSFEKTGTIYSLWRNFRARRSWLGQCPDPIVARHLNRYWWVRRFDAAIERARRRGDVSEASERAITRRIMKGARTGKEIHWEFVGAVEAPPAVDAKGRPDPGERARWSWGQARPPRHVRRGAGCVRGG